jgi:flagellar hook-associated protein 3 FlgL
MRVNPNPTSDLLAALNRTRQEEENALLELSSGHKVNQPSDDPAAAALLTDNFDRATFVSSYLSNITAIQAQMQTADSTFSSIETALQSALTVGIEAANGTLNASDRSAIVQELQGTQQQLLSLANTAFQGRYLFSGTATDTRPFLADPTAPSGVRYEGNDAVNQVAIGDGYDIAVNQPGDSIFMANGRDMFLALANLTQAVQNNTGYDAAIAGLRDAYDNIAAQRVFYGNGIKQAQSQASYLNAAKLQLSEQENTLGGADIAAAASRLANAETATNATLSAMAGFSRLSLFDYLNRS